MRYEAEWLLECLMLRIKSNKAYKHMQDILPLPSQSTLVRLIGGMCCHFGFNKMSLEAIAKCMATKTKSERMGSLCFDEVAILEQIVFNPQTFCFDGFLDLEDDSNITGEEFVPTGAPDVQEETDSLQQNNTQDKSFFIDDDILELEDDDLDEEETNPETPSSTTSADKKLANHALVFMFRPYQANWVQPFAVFGSAGAASGENIYRLLLKALIILKQNGATVTSVVCDGAQPNKTAWKKAGIGCTSDEVINKMVHPTDPENMVHFLLDPPHAFKCIRNQIHNNVKVQVISNSNTKI
jgi:hypothetical protein